MAPRMGLPGCHRQPVRAPPISPRPASAPIRPIKRLLPKALPGVSFQQGRAAAINRLQNARTLQDLQDVVDRYSDYLSPAEVQQLVTSVAPRLAQQQRSIELQRRQQEEQRRRQLEQLQQRVLAQQQDPRMSGQLSARQSSAPAGYPRPPQVASGLPLGARGAAQQRAAAAEALARREEEAARQRQLMEQLAGMTRKTLPDLRQQAAAGNLADTVHALAHAGALDEGLAQELLQSTAEAASTGQLDVQGLADVLAALGKARFRPSPSAIRQLISDVNPLDRCRDAGELSALLNGLSRIGYKADDAFVSEAVRRLQQRQAAAQQQQQQAPQPPASTRMSPTPPQVIQTSPSPRPDPMAYSTTTPAQQQQQDADESEFEEDGFESEESDEVEILNDPDAIEEQREIEEASHVAAAIQALRRMGHTRQAQELQQTYLRDLQAHAAERMQAQQQREAERQAQLQLQREAAEAEQRRRQEAEAAARREMQAKAAAAAQQARQAEEERKRQAEEEKRRQAQAAAAAAAAKAQADAAAAAADAKRKLQEAEARQQSNTLVQAAIARARSWRQLVPVLYSAPPESLGPAELSAFIQRLAHTLAAERTAALTWRDRNALGEALEQWTELMVGVAQQNRLSPGDLVTSMKALASLQYLNGDLWGLLLRDARAKLSAFTGTQLTDMIRALATARLKPSTQWQTAFVDASLKHLKDLTPDELLDTCKSMAQLEIQPGSEWILAYLGQLEIEEDQMNMPQAAACLQAAAQLDTPLVKRWYTELLRKREQLNKQKAVQSVPPQTPTPPQSAPTPAKSDATVPPATPPRPIPPALSSLSDALTTDEILEGTMPHTDTDATDTSSTQGDAQDTMAPQQQQEASAGPAEARTEEGAKGDVTGTASSAAAAAAPAPPPAPVESIDFDEEASRPASGGPAQLPDTFLLDRLHPTGAHAQDTHSTHAKHRKHKKKGRHAGLREDRAVSPKSQRGQAGVAGAGQSVSAGGGGKGGGGGRVDPAQQLRDIKALRSVLLERVEMAEEAVQVVERYEARLAASAEKFAAAKGAVDSLQADFDRVMKRTAEEKQAIAEKVRLDVFSKLLPLLDNFDRASQSLRPQTQGEQAVVDAYQTVPAMAMELLESAGVSEVPGVGTPFNPAVHDAIMQEYDTSVPDGTVLMVLQKGYQAGDTLLRPALVKVSTC